MSKRSIAALVYLGMIFVAGVLIYYRRDDLHWMRVAYRAAATLPKNHRLAEGDLILPRRLPKRLRKALPEAKDLAGKYLRREIPRNGVIRPADLLDAPSLDAPPGQVAVMFKISDAAVCGSLDAGDWLKFYTTAYSPIPDRQAKVIATLGTAAPCVAALAVHPDEADFFLHPHARLILFERGRPMKQHWSTPTTVQIEATPAGQWQKVLDVVAPKTTLRIEAKGEWTVGGVKCTPDGLLVAPAESRSIADYPAGALLGKLGGSTAGSHEGTVFAIGRYCIVESPDKASPLFVAVNAASTAALQAAQKIDLTISEGE